MSERADEICDGEDSEHAKLKTLSGRTVPPRKLTAHIGHHPGRFVQILCRHEGFYNPCALPAISSHFANAEYSTEHNIWILQRKVLIGKWS
jgi:hypothetical protein